MSVPTPRPTIASVRGMVAAAHPLAAAAGAGVLRDGGNAFDAAVATAAALNVAEPFMSGLAGCGMAVGRTADGTLHALDFVTAVPGAFDAGACTKDDVFVGARASAPPGNLAGWAALAGRLGTRPLDDLLAPAIALARDGVPVTETLPAVTGEWLDLRRRDAEWLLTYTDGRGAAPLGWLLRQPALADTLTAIAEHGPGHLYAGPLGERVVAHMRAGGGWLSMDDLAAVEARWVAPLESPYRSWRLATLPPPAESFQFLLTLAVLERFDLASLEPDGVDHLDTVFRAIRLAAEERITRNRSPRADVEALLASAAADRLAERVRDGRPLAGRTQQWRAITDPDRVWRREHTTSFAAGDADGNLVCVTQSLGSIYGSGVVIPGTGVCMNNFLNWGDLEPDSPNHLRPGARLAMCLAPCVATGAGGDALAFGTPGSYGILQTQPQVLVQHCDFGRPLAGAIEAPRARLWDGTLALVESRVAPAVIEGLRARGHDARPTAPWTRKVGGFHAVSRRGADGVLVGAADPRRDGYAVPV